MFKLIIVCTFCFALCYRIVLRKTFPFLLGSVPFCSLSIQGSSWSVGLTVYLSISVKFAKNARLSPCYRERTAVVCFEINTKIDKIHV